jgi:2-dehydropantoate 2-reductase
MTPRVLIFGTGAMACFFAARLGRSGRAQVTLAGTWLEAITNIGARGITVLEDEGTWQARIAARSLAEPLPEADLVLVLVKSTQTALVAPLAARASAPGGLVVTLQNGLGNAAILEAATGAGRVAQGVAFLGAALLAPGLVRLFPGRVVVGAVGTAPSRVHDLALLLAKSGFIGEVVEDVTPHLWLKLAANCAINPLSALLHVANGKLLDSPEARQMMEAAAREVAEVARAKGIDLGQDAVAATLEVAQRTADNRSSMLQDVEGGRPTEIEFLSGAVVREGQALGVPTPVNAVLLDRVRRLTTGPLSDALPSLVGQP